MKNKITTEVLAKANNDIKDIVQRETNKFQLIVEEKKVNYHIIYKVASDDKNQFNAMTFAPIVNGKPDYNNTAVVFAGTNTNSDVGSNGFASAGEAFVGGLSSEYKLAEIFLNGSYNKVSKEGGQITDVGGFSQSGGYTMHLVAEYGSKYGFSATTFDDWGRDQHELLTADQKKWLKNNPERLTRYQNDSWAGLSGRDSVIGTVFKLDGVGFSEHNSLSKYFDGDTLNLERLAKDGIFAPNMTKAQVELAAENWAKKYGDLNPYTGDRGQAKKRAKKYLELYGSYGREDFDAQSKKMSKLRDKFEASGGGISTNEEIYLDDSQALFSVSTASQIMKEGLTSVIKIYEEAIAEAEVVWDSGLQLANIIGTELSQSEILESLAMVNATQSSVQSEPTVVYQNKITKAKELGDGFDSLVLKIELGIDHLVQSDQELARQLRS